MKKFFIGVDISKENLDVCIYKKSKMQLISEFSVKNSESGIKLILNKITHQKIDLKDVLF